MSISDRRSREDGFTLVEILVAMGLVSIVMIGAVPALLGVMKSGTITRDHTRAKNLTQQRLEQIRDLAFHVDRQNGPFLDLLDIYYTHALTGSAATSVNNGGTALSGVYVPAGSAAVSGEPTAPYFRVTTGALPGNTEFSQVITTQFLAPNGVVVPAARFQGTTTSTTGYTSQIAGRDEPPSLMVEVAVTTTWSQAGQTKSYVAKTRVTDGRPERPLIQSQARAVAVELTSTAADGSTLGLQAGVTTIDGAQSNGSSVAGLATGAVATRSGAAAVNALQASFQLPGSAVSTSGSSTAVTPTDCSWYGFGHSSLTNVSGDVSTGLPKAPTNVGSAAPFSVMGASLTANGSPTCGVLSYGNVTTGGTPRPSTDALGQHMGQAPYVEVANPAGGGNSAVLGASGYVTSNAITSTPQRTASGASATVAAPIVFFPNSPGTGRQGLLQVSLTSAQVDCSSGSTASSGSATGSYTALQLRWFGISSGETAPRWHAATWDYSGTGAPTARSGSETWNPAQTLVPRWNATTGAFEASGGTTLDQLVSLNVPSSTSGVLTEGATNGQRGFPNGIMTITTATTLLNETAPGYSAIKAQIGQVSCVAVDER